MPSENTLPPNLTCGKLIDELVSTDEAMLSLPTRVHLSECLHCQNEVRSYQRLRLMMRTLASEPTDPAPNLEHAISDLLDKCDNNSARRIQTRAAAALGGIAAAAGVFVLAKRQRRTATLAV